MCNTELAEKLKQARRQTQVVTSKSIGAGTQRVGCSQVGLDPCTCGVWGIHDTPGDLLIRCALKQSQMRSDGPVCAWKEKVPTTRQVDAEQTGISRPRLKVI